MTLDASERRVTKQHTGGVLEPPQEPDQQLPCPRCDSTNTKFCYYNNYNLSQPRYFCKSCRRYWTRGGTLRDIPVGGGSRKNAKRSRIYHSTPAAISPHVASGNSPFLDPPPPSLNMNGNFTSFLSSHALGGFEDMSFGIGRTPVWPFPGAVNSYVRHNNNGVGAYWQLSGGEGGFVGSG
ncbi:hypothetical protein K7X08_017468 [Anisodus acutangulus]|uniref:Dof zinc finger protein n=1 Tax=Anisodus acutangulus TaxID=402998 RepID=A0A9Q1LXS0_9SOLA|nr:hypothetical protein K7X08_017468 [Anisodus acutangulus]